jgi:uncharacterized membrane protein YdjX (TVP38/TMEM64 family)
MKITFTPGVKNWLRVGAILALALVFIIPQSRRFVFFVVELLGKADIEPIRDYILSFGALAVVISFLLMVIQSVAAPLPAFLITFANAAVFGWVRGAVLSWTSAMAGAALCFGIARLFGRDVVVKFTGKTALETLDGYFYAYGVRSILVARLLPFVPFDPISYAAGLTTISLPKFLLATGVGQLPATIAYSYFGSSIGWGTKIFISGLFVLFAIVTLSTVLRGIYVRYKKKKQIQSTEEKTGEHSG